MVSFPSRQVVPLALAWVVAGCPAKELSGPGTKPETAVAAQAPPASIHKPHVDVPHNLAWLAFGGGGEPLSNQVSLAQDISRLASSLRAPGIVLFASGPGAPVAIEDGGRLAPARDVHEALSRLFGVPGTSRTRYQAAELDIDGPSTSEHVMRALSQALARGSEPLLVYAASHGEQGQIPAENSLGLWGGWSIKVKDVARLIDLVDHPRPSRFVITACYGGGFAELLFTGAEPARGLRESELCGLFAAPWDDEASGCDPNPDRRAQESYSIHFLHALEGHDRHGGDRLQAIDIDGDGSINLLEAHTWARIHSRSFDIPTTTSERYLRYAAPLQAFEHSDPASAPEDLAVVQALGGELGILDENEARNRLDQQTSALEEAHDAVAEAQKSADDAFYALRIALLERWPLLDHPWDRRTRALLANEGDEIRVLLVDSPLAAAQLAAERRLQAALADFDEARIGRARVLRLVRAYETLRLASALKRHGGPEHARYQAIRRCERYAPQLKRPLRARSTGRTQVTAGR